MNFNKIPKKSILVIYIQIVKHECSSIKTFILYMDHVLMSPAKMSIHKEIWNDS